MSAFKRLTPIVPGEAQPLLWIDSTIKTGFVTGGSTEGRGFPQWAIPVFGSSKKAHYFEISVLDNQVGISLCNLVMDVSGLFLPGNFGRCKVCEREYTKALRAGVGK